LLNDQSFPFKDFPQIIRAVDNLSAYTGKWHFSFGAHFGEGAGADMKEPSGGIAPKSVEMNILLILCRSFPG
jgi:hypothetical protein